MITSDTISTIIDKNTSTNVANYNNVTFVQDNTPDTLVNKESVAYIISEYKQGPAGPAGPATGISTASEGLVFIGSGIGNTKTSTGINGNIIYEAFGVGDELYMTWIIPDDIDRSVNPNMTGTIFALTNNAGTFDTSWEIHITVHNIDHTYEYTGIISALDIAFPAIAFEDIHAAIEIDKAVYLINNTHTMHIKLKRVASTNNTTSKIGVSDIHLDYSTDGKVGVQGATGATGLRCIVESKKINNSR